MGAFGVPVSEGSVYWKVWRKGFRPCFSYHGWLDTDTARVQTAAPPSRTAVRTEHRASNSTAQVVRYQSTIIFLISGPKTIVIHANSGYMCTPRELFSTTELADETVDFSHFTLTADRPSLGSHVGKVRYIVQSGTAAHEYSFVVL